MKLRSLLPSRAIKGEEGTTVVLVAFSLVVLMGFAAIAIDGAAAWALKRQDQSGADTGAIAGALFTADRTKADAIDAAEDEIIRITYATMTPDMPFTDWETEWTACTDPGKPAEFTETLGSDCISFTDNLDHVRVATPIMPWYTTFGQVIGFDRIDTRAVAEVNTALDSSGVLPFGMPGGASGVDQICLKSGPNPNGEPPCDGPVTGNFGFLNFTQFGNSVFGTTQDCTPDIGTLTTAIAIGVDHPLGQWPPRPPYSDGDPIPPLPAPSHEDRDACDDGNFNSRPYDVFTNTGNMAQVLDDGFAGDGAGLDGKLESGSTINIRGNDLNNEPLWDFLTDDGKLYCGPIANHDEMEACLKSHRLANSAVELFDDDIIDAARWGWVPLFHGTDLGNGATSLTIFEFRAVYIQTVFMGCNANTCDVIWDPGEPWTEPGPGPNNVRIEASTALQLPRASLPEAARLSEPGSDTQVQYLLSK